MPACSRSHWEIKLFRNNQITVRVLACDHVWKVYCNDQKCGASRLDCREGGSGGWASQNMLKYIKKRVLCQWEMTTKCRKAPSFLNSVTGVQWMHMLWNMYVGKQCSLAWLMNNIKWRWSVVLCAYKCCGEVSGPHGRWFQSGLKGSYEAVADETDDLLFVVGGSGGWLIWLRMVVMLIVEHWECVWFSKLHWKHEGSKHNLLIICLIAVTFSHLLTFNIHFWTMSKKIMRDFFHWKVLSMTLELQQFGRLEAKLIANYFDNQFLQPSCPL